MKDKIKYSIIIPTHNNEKTIDRCINAILNSKFNEGFELIVVDDASYDDTATIAKQLGAEVIRNAVRGGPSKARNVGAKHAKGTILIFVDSDVLLFPDTLQKIDNFFNNEREFSALSCSFDPTYRQTNPLSIYKNLYMCYLLANQPKSVTWTFTSTLAIKKEAFDSIKGFNEKVRVMEDDLLGRELVKKGHKLALGKDILVQHLQIYSLPRFIKEEYRRSRILTTIQLTACTKKIKSVKKNMPKNMLFSTLLFPLLLLGVVLHRFNIVFVIMSILVFYSVNLYFLRFCKKTCGIKLMLYTVLIMPLDCLLSNLGIIAGISDFCGGKRI